MSHGHLWYTIFMKGGDFVMDYKRNTRYFRGVSYTLPIIGIVLGFILMASEVIIGLLLVAGSIGLIIFLMSLVPSDEEIDDVTFSHLKNIKNDAIKNITDAYSDFTVQEPIVISHYYYKPFDGNSVLTKRGKDGFVRSSAYASSIFLFTDHQLIHQRVVYSIINPALKTFTEEYYYDDIVTVKSHQSQSSPFDQSGVYKDVSTFTSQTFELITKGGNNITYTFRNNKQVDTIVTYMKQMIRKNKMTNDSHKQEG